MKLSLFYKSYAHDFDWLRYSRDSIRKFSGDTFHEIVLLLPEGETFDWPEARIEYVKDLAPGYIGQMAWKCYADKFCTGDFVVFGDSDVILTRPVSQDDFIHNGKAIWYYTPFGNAREDQSIWKAPMREFIGSEPPNECMRKHNFCWPREFFDRLRSFCKFKHRKELVDYIMSKGDITKPLQLVWSEFNCAGAFAWEHEREMFSWMRENEGPSSYNFQGHTHSGEQRKQEDIAKFKELLGSPSGDGGNGVQGEPATSLRVHETPTLTIASAIQFLASQATSNAIKGEIVRKLKKAWKGSNVRIAGGGRKKFKFSPVLSPDEQVLTDLKKRNPGSKGTRFPTIEEITEAQAWNSTSTLLCIHSYPGANETVKRHWPSFLTGGFNHIVGIGTTDGKCTWPDGLDGVVDIGENAYMKMRGPDDHLCRRLLDTVKWCMTQPDSHFAVAEYDTIFLKKLPLGEGVCAHNTGGKINGSRTNMFHHNPWKWSREDGPKLIKAMENALPLSQTYPDNSPDLFFGLACDMAGIKVTCPWKMFTRNSLDVPGDLDLACKMAKDGVHVIHGVKKEHEYTALMDALNGSGLLLSKTA